MAALRVTTLLFCVGFFKNNHNQVNIGDPIEDIMIGEYHTIHHTYGEILPRRMSTTACSFASHFGQEMAQNADMPISCKNFSGVIPPHPRPVLGHIWLLFPDSRCFGSHNFQIVPARLLLPYGQSYKSITHLVPDRVKPSFVIFDIRAL